MANSVSLLLFERAGGDTPARKGTMEIKPSDIKNRMDELTTKFNELSDQWWKQYRIINGDPRTPEQVALDEWQADWNDTIESVRPGM